MDDRTHHMVWDCVLEIGKSVDPPAHSRALTDPGVIQRLLDQGVEATPGTPTAFRELIVAQTERWRTVIKSAGITADAAQ